MSRDEQLVGSTLSTTLQSYRSLNYSHHVAHYTHSTFSNFPSPKPLPLITTNLISLSLMCVCAWVVLFVFFLKIPYISEIIQNMSFSDFFHLASRSIHVVANCRMSSFYGWIIFHCVCVCVCVYTHTFRYIYYMHMHTYAHIHTPQLLYPFIHRRTFRVFSHLHNYK